MGCVYSWQPLFPVFFGAFSATCLEKAVISLIALRPTKIEVGYGWRHRRLYVPLCRPWRSLRNFRTESGSVRNRSLHPTGIRTHVLPIYEKDDSSNNEKKFPHGHGREHKFSHHVYCQKIQVIRKVTNWKRLAWSSVSVNEYPVKWSRHLTLLLGFEGWTCALVGKTKNSWPREVSVSTFRREFITASQTRL